MAKSKGFYMHWASKLIDHFEFLKNQVLAPAWQKLFINSYCTRTKNLYRDLFRIKTAPQWPVRFGSHNAFSRVPAASLCLAARMDGSYGRDLHHNGRWGYRWRCLIINSSTNSSGITFRKWLMPIVQVTTRFQHYRELVLRVSLFVNELSTLDGN